jgi:hypothetical protein
MDAAAAAALAYAAFLERAVLAPPPVEEQYTLSFEDYVDPDPEPYVQQT